jgi:hypothetical protein
LVDARILRDEALGLAKTRAIAELAGKAADCLGSNGSNALPSGPAIGEVNWEELEALYRAGVLPRKAPQDVADKTRSHFVMNALSNILRMSTATFEDAQIR